MDIEGLLPQSILEGGSEAVEDLIAAIVRRIEELAVGGILEVVSWVPGVASAIEAWCQQAGHELLHIIENGAKTHIWIRRRGEG